MKSWQVRGALNWVNASTPLGLVVARAGGASIERGPRDLRLAGGYHWAFPTDSAFTVGSVMISAQSLAWLRSQESLLVHEERHSTQWATLGGMPFLPLYLVATAYSQWRVGDRGSANIFERLAGLDAGGYRVPSREEIEQLRERRRVHRAAVVPRALALALGRRVARTTPRLAPGNTAVRKASGGGSAMRARSGGVGLMVWLWRCGSDGVGLMVWVCQNGARQQRGAKAGRRARCLTIPSIPQRTLTRDPTRCPHCRRALARDGRRARAGLRDPAL